MPHKPLLLIILDGWGYNPSTKGNAIALARKPTWDELTAKFPHTLIHTSGPYVGLPEGQMGNSEVGHLNIGAGRIIHMDITRIDQMIETGEFFRDPLLVGAMKHARTRQLHLLGLLSDGGVRSWLKRHPRFHLHCIPTSSSWLHLVERWFREITDQRIRRGSFQNVASLVAAIQQYIDTHNQNPKVFIWSAPAERIMSKIAKCKEALETLH